MNFSENKLEIQEFDLENSQVFHYKNDENLIINVFFLFANKKNIENQWKVFSNIIAAKFQNSDYMSENKDFEKWNFYIIYISKEKLPKELKNRIENDRFSSRKIVEDNYSNDFNSDEANKLIIKHITNTDLKDIIDQTQDKIQVEYKPIDAELWKLIHKDVSLVRDVDSQKQIVEQISQQKQ
ncbi:hypothetical protein D0T49_02355 [Paludibacter sp. 221]|uniref:ABC-three component system middle component 1 n=1 Tax=Paludibacter sp. 221 TaxID=2302939 RepID=UPI0013CF4730|nr:ABC-three component system middle component 1 [Paludibacter sp. 221]NDV45892.1 hypothetical protein [Paludibacter sp. 221]